MGGFKFHPNILIVTEGYTEKNYLKHLSQRYAGYTICIEKSPQEKAIKAIKTCVSIYKKDFSKKYGDIAYCVVDVDNNSEEDISESIRIAKKNGIGLILSKPCFEIFFLMHFTNHVQMKMTSKETKKELMKYIPNYKETNDYWELLLKDQQKTIEMSRLFKLTEQDFSLEKLSNGTNIYELFDKIEEFKKKYGAKQ